MGISPSKRAYNTLQTSTTFTTSCNDVFTTFQSRTPPPTILPNQLVDAITTLHTQLHSLSTPPILSRWAPHPPSRTHVDKAYKSLSPPRGQEGLPRGEFLDFAAKVFAEVIVANAVKEVALVGPVCAVGLVGLGALKGAQGGLVGIAVGAVVGAVATSVYVRLG